MQRKKEDDNFKKTARTNVSNYTLVRVGSFSEECGYAKTLIGSRFGSNYPIA